MMNAGFSFSRERQRPNASQTVATGPIAIVTSYSGEVVHGDLARDLARDFGRRAEKFWRIFDAFHDINAQAQPLKSRVGIILVCHSGGST
jgi:hypothetical protein